MTRQALRGLAATEDAASAPGASCSATAPWSKRRTLINLKELNRAIAKAPVQSFAAKPVRIKKYKTPGWTIPKELMEASWYAAASLLKPPKIHTGLYATVAHPNNVNQLAPDQMVAYPMANFGTVQYVPEDTMITLNKVFPEGKPPAKKSVTISKEEILSYGVGTWGGAVKKAYCLEKLGVKPEYCHYIWQHTDFETGGVVLTYSGPESGLIPLETQDLAPSN